MLILRKNCQPLLNAAGLNMMHVEQGTHTKTLAIVGGCGKVLVNIAGIRFGKATINAKEREYAEELFSEFIAKHGKVLKKYAVAKQARLTVVVPELPKEIGALQGPNVVRIIPLKASSSSAFITVYNTGVINFNFGVKDVKDVSKVYEECLPKIEIAQKFLKEYTKYTKAGTQLQKELQEIGACSI